MITTLPGLYLVTVGILKPFILLLGVDTACSVSGLRLVNILFQAGTFYVLRAIYKTIHSTPQADNKVSFVWKHVQHLCIKINTLQCKGDRVFCEYIQCVTIIFNFDRSNECTYVQYLIFFKFLKNLAFPLLFFFLQEADKVALVTAITLIFFPLLHFFTFLYYTDPGSTFFVLLMYLFHLHGNKTLAAFMGGMSILFRHA